VLETGYEQSASRLQGRTDAGVIALAIIDVRQQIKELREATKELPEPPRGVKSALKEAAQITNNSEHLLAQRTEFSFPEAEAVQLASRYLSIAVKRIHVVRKQLNA
jgi:lipid II:glycine glycyltransferase (peptidoglycan interpeptide bridge formation enzyme)